jgi:protein-tyrosine phosphatase
MVEREVQEGVTNIILTPHYPHTKLQKQQRIERFEAFRDEVDKRGLPVHLYLGNEVLYSDSFLEDLADGKICTINQTSYVLIEFYPDTPFSQIRYGVNETIMAGYRPILAHVERYSALQSEKRIREVVKMGAYIQVNTSSFFRKHTKKFLLSLAQKNLIHLLGSDCHSVRYRPPIMRETAKLLQKELGPEQFETLFYKNPANILENRYL